MKVIWIILVSSAYFFPHLEEEKIGKSNKYEGEPKEAEPKEELVRKEISDSVPVIEHETKIAIVNLKEEEEVPETD